ncbi:hypothetical protein BD626DRAFT_532935 [Schizophyllum amplum]|uniref:Uncharacterized protein n=1 Tax=Schizophyllum amplum TaxID=97359 RepID=A0A550CWH5_9AGAR|nr:hypothetical protein BD626DRAFT_532935 [Auriculariopsis ampla]
MAMKLDAIQPRVLVRKLKTIYRTKRPSALRKDDPASKEWTESHDPASKTAISGAEAEALDCAAGLPTPATRPDQAVLSPLLERIEQLEREVLVIKARLSDRSAEANLCTSAYAHAVQTKSIGVQVDADVDVAITVGKSASAPPFDDTIEIKSSTPVIPLGPNDNSSNTSFATTNLTPDLTFDPDSDTSYSASSLFCDKISLADASNVAELTCARADGTLTHGYVVRSDESAVPAEEESLKDVSHYVTPGIVSSSDQSEDIRDTASDGSPIGEAGCPQTKRTYKRSHLLLNRRPSYETIGLVRSQFKHSLSNKGKSGNMTCEAEDAETHLESGRRPTVFSAYMQRMADCLVPRFTWSKTNLPTPRSMKLGALPHGYDEPPPAYTLFAPGRAPTAPNDMPVQLEDTAVKELLVSYGADPETLSAPISGTTLGDSLPADLLNLPLDHLMEIVDLYIAGAPVPQYAFNSCTLIRKPRAVRPINIRNMHIESDCPFVPEPRSALMISHDAPLWYRILPITVVNVYGEVDPANVRDTVGKAAAVLGFSYQSKSRQATGKIWDVSAMVKAQDFMYVEMQKYNEAEAAEPPSTPDLPYPEWYTEETGAPSCNEKVVPAVDDSTYAIPIDPDTGFIEDLITPSPGISQSLPCEEVVKCKGFPDSAYIFPTDIDIDPYTGMICDIITPSPDPELAAGLLNDVP